MGAPSPANQFPSKTADITMQRCQSCGNMRMTKFVAFYRNIGMIVARRTQTIRGNFCKSCVHKHFWTFEAKNLVFGPWGTFSLLLTPIYMVQNIFNYLIALYKLRGALE